MDNTEHTENLTPIRRDVLTRFKKGQVNNPTGTRGPLKDAIHFQKLSVEQLYREHAVEVFEALLKLIRTKDIAPTAKINAIKEYNSRALGSPTSTTIVKAGRQAEEDVDLSDLTNDVLRQVVERANAKKD